MRVLECVCARVGVCTHLSTIVLPASVRGTVLLELSPPGAMPPLANPLSPGPNANRTDNVYFYRLHGSCVCFSNASAGGGEAHTTCRDMTHGKISSRSYRMRRRRRRRIPVTGPETNTRTEKINKPTPTPTSTHTHICTHTHTHTHAHTHTRTAFRHTFNFFETTACTSLIAYHDTQRDSLAPVRNRWAGQYWQRVAPLVTSLLFPIPFFALLCASLQLQICIFFFNTYVGFDAKLSRLTRRRDDGTPSKYTVHITCSPSAKSSQRHT